MTDKLKKGYLQWRCRRGTKELDIILCDFLEKNYNSLNHQQLQDFNQLLESQDTVLWEFLSGKKESKNPSLQQLINNIRITVTTHPSCHSREGGNLLPL